jgi:hypothetical protein
MSSLTTDAGGHEIGKLRGLRVCEVCGLVIGQGYTNSDGGGLCSDECLAKAQWSHLYLDGGGSNADALEVIVDRSDIVGLLLALEQAGGEKVGYECFIYWTDWEGYEHSEGALERLLKEPYNWTPDEIKSLEEANA